MLDLFPYFSDAVKEAYDNKHHTLLSVGGITPEGKPKKSVAKQIGYGSGSLQGISEAARGMDKGVRHPFNPLTFNKFHTGAGAKIQTQGKIIRGQHEQAVDSLGKAMRAHLQGGTADNINPHMARFNESMGNASHITADYKHKAGPVEGGYATRARGKVPGYVASGVEHIKSDYAKPGANNSSLRTLGRMAKSKITGQSPQGSNAIDVATGTTQDGRAVRRNEAMLRTTKKKAYRQFQGGQHSPQQLDDAFKAVTSMKPTAPAKKVSRLRGFGSLLRSAL